MTNSDEAQGALENDEHAHDALSVPLAYFAGIPTDPGLNTGQSYYQWNLTGTWGIRVDQVWPDYTGTGVRIAVLDDGFEYTNSELSANYNRSIDFDTTGSNDSDAAAGSADNHGTAVAGVIGADNDGVGVVGVAHDAELVGIRLDFNGGIQSIREGFQYAWTHGADVLNNSWGYPATFVDNLYIPYSDGSFASVQNDLIDAVSLGRGGLGMSVVFAAGNGRMEDQDVNNHMLSSSPYTIAVAGTDKNGNLFDYSTPGAAILTAAPAEGVYTVDKEGTRGYVSGDIVGISGTSFSAPTVTGVIALMYEANAGLGYRDVQDILALASRKANQTSWQTNGATNWNGGGMHFSHDYGFGLIDAYAAVRLAESWGTQKTYANMETASYSTSSNVYLADRSSTDFTFNVTADLVVEHAVLNLILPHDKAGDLVITLISPEGTESTLVNRLDFGSYVTDAVGYYQGIHAKMDSVANWGEHSAGTWTLRIEDRASGNDGYLRGATLTILGSQVTPDDTYYFTDEFAGATLSDANGGIDTLNLAAVRGNAIVDLTGAQVSRFAGDTLVLSNPSAFENIYAGDGNDTLKGNDADNSIHAGRGNDTITGSAGDDTLDGGEGTDSVSFAANLGNFVVDILDAVSARLVDTVTNFGTNIIRNVEQFLFSNHNYSWAQLVDHAGGIPVTETVEYSIRAGRYWSTFTSEERGELGLQAADLRYRGTAEYVHVERSTDAMILTRLTDISNPVTSLKMAMDRAFDLTAISFPYAYITLGGAENSTLVFHDLLAGAITTGAGHDAIDLDFSDVSRRTGNLVIHTGEGDDVITGIGGSGAILSSVYGEDGDDTIHATAGKNLLYGGAGNDTFTLEDGYAKIFGGVGDDVGSVTGAGRVLFYGEDGNDSFHASSAADYLKGDSGDDHLYGGDGNDRLYGDDGADTLYGEGGRDLIYGGNGDDLLVGGDDNDKLYGQNDNDTLEGGAGNDYLHGGYGDDHLFGGAGNDTLYGDRGADTYHFDLVSVDTVKGFSLREGDVLDVSDILSGYNEGVSDVNDFVMIKVLSRSQAQILVNADGADDDFQAVGMILTDFSRTSVDELHASGAFHAG
ncbi:MAG: S8 family serine peptidase [Pseudobdellovibrionaceae bacterium]